MRSLWKSLRDTDSTLDEQILARFIKAYQEITPLGMGEVWAVPIMLRLGLIENLRRLADSIVETQFHRRCGEAWADEIIDARPTMRRDCLPSGRAIYRSCPRRWSPSISDSATRDTIFRSAGTGYISIFPTGADRSTTSSGKNTSARHTHRFRRATPSPACG